MKQTLREQASRLLKSAVELYEKKQIQEQELKIVYATMREIIDLAKTEEKQSAPKQVAIPEEIKQSIQNALSSVPLEWSSLARGALISRGGKEMEKILDWIEQEKELAPAPSLSSLPRSLTNMALQISVGLKLEDIENPTFWTQVKGAILAARVAQVIFAPAFSLWVSTAWVVGNLAFYTLRQLSYIFFPDAIKAISRLQNLAIGSALSHLLFTKEQIEQVDSAIAQWSSMLDRSGAVSFELPGIKKKTPPTPLEKRVVLLQKASFEILPSARIINQFASHIPSEAPRPAEDLPPTNPVEQLAKILRQKLYVCPEEEELIQFLNESIAELPIPTPGKTGDAWEKVEEKKSCIKILSLLAMDLGNQEKISVEKTEKRSVQTRLNLFKIYAIIDKLARALPEMKLEGFQPNGWELAQWHQHPSFRHCSVKMREQLNGLQRYFGIDPQTDVWMDEDASKIEKAYRSTLFFPTQEIRSDASSSQEFGWSLNESSTESYLKQFLRDPSVVEKLKQKGVLEGASYAEKIIHLYASDAVDPILPEEFHHLRIADLMAHNASMLSGKELADLTTPKTHMEKYVVVHQKDNRVRKVLHGMTFGLYFQKGEIPSLDLIPGSKVVEFEQRHTTQAWTPLPFQFGRSLLPRNERILRRPASVTHNLHFFCAKFFLLPPRTQNEIMAQIDTYREYREPRKNDLANYLLQIVDSPRTATSEHNFAALLPKHARALFEMIRVDREDQAVRLLAYFSQNIHRLAEDEFQSVFRIALLQADSLYPYRKKHPEFEKTLESFFDQCLDYYLQRQDHQTYYALCEIAILAEGAVPGKSGLFEKIEARLSEIYSSGKFDAEIPLLLALPWNLIDLREPAQQSKIHRGIKQLLRSYAAIRKATCVFNNTPLEHLYNTLQETWRQWESTIQETLDGDPHFRNRTLNALLELQQPREWSGKFPSYKTVDLEINVSTGTIWKDLEYIEKIHSHSQRFFNLSTERFTPQKGGGYAIDNLELFAESTAEGSEISLYKMHRGKKYFPMESISTAGNRELGRTSIWICDEGLKKAQAIELNRDATVIGKYTASKAGEAYVLEPTAPSSDASLDKLIEIDLAQEAHHLHHLAWFQPLSSIRAFARESDPAQICKIAFTKFQMEFHVADGKASGQGMFSGLSIAATQWREDLYPALNDYSRYLLLETSGKEHKVALPADTIASTLLSWIAKKCASLETPQLLDRSIDSAFELMENRRCFLYDFDEKGRLTSGDPEAVLYLLCLHLAQDQKGEMRRDLIRLENLGRRKKFTPLFSSLSLLIGSYALLSKDLDISRAALRLAAITEENRILQQVDVKSRSKEEKLLSWVLFQALSLSSSQQGEDSPLFPISEFQELTLYSAIESYAAELISSSEQANWFRDFASKWGIDGMTSLFLMHPSISDRYDYLKQKYSSKQKTGSIFFQTAVRTLVFGSSGSSSEARDGIGSLVLQYLSRPEDLLRYSPTVLGSIDLSNLDLSASLENLPVEASKIGTEEWEKYLHLYYRLAYGPEPKDETQTIEELDRFYQKREALRRSLCLMRGKSTGIEPLDQWIEVLPSLWNKRLLSGFPHPDQLVEIAQKLRSRVKHQDDVQKFFEWCQNLCSASRSTDRFQGVSSSLVGSFASSHGKEFLKKTALSYGASLLTKTGGIAPAISVAHTLYSTFCETNLRLQQLDRENEVLRTRKTERNRPLTQDLQTQLIENDQALAALCSSLLEESFAVEIISPFSPRKVEPFDANSNDALVEKYFGRLNQSLSDFYDREEARRVAIVRPSLEQWYAFGARLQSARQLLENLVGEYASDLVEAAKKRENVRNEPNLLQTVRSFFSNGKLEKEEYLQELVQHFGKGRLGEYLRSDLDPAEIENKLYRYCLFATRLHQLERAHRIWESGANTSLESPEGKTLLQQLSFEMYRERAYSWEENLPPSLFRGYLLFEYGTKAMLWKKQVQQIQQILLGPDRRAVLELLTGSGKTFFGIPFIDFFGSDGSQLVYNCFPDSLSEVCIEQVSDTSSKVFGQSANAVEVSRSKRPSAEVLLTLLRAQSRAVVEAEHFNGRKKDLQSLELLFIELLASQKKDLSQSAERMISLYQRLLSHIRTKVRGNVDEAHHLFRRNQELNYPFGPKMHLREIYVDVIRKCAHLLTSNERVAERVGLDRALPHCIDPKEYHQTIKPILAEELSKWELLDVSITKRNEFVAYLCGNTKEIPPFVLDHPRKQEIGLAVGVLNQLLPEALAKKIFVDYGPSKAGNGEYARPYAGNDSPVETATIKNPFEATLKTCLLFLHTGLSESQAEKLLSKLNELAETQTIKRGILYTETEAARVFHKWTKGSNLKAAAKEKNKQILSLLKTNDQAILAYVKYCVAPEITYFAKNLRSDSQNFASMFSSFYADTATPSRDGTFPTGTKVLWDKGTAGEFVDFVCKNCNSPNSMVEVRNQEPEKALAELLERIFLPDNSAKVLIDAGAMFKGMSNRKVAEKIRSFLDEKLPYMRAVVFFDENQKLVSWEKGVPNPVPFAQSSIPPAQRLTYLDQTHIFGADVRQDIGAKGIVTISHTTTLEELTQAGGRMRGLKSAGQRLIFAVPQSISHLIAGQPLPSVQNVLSFSQAQMSRSLQKSTPVSNSQAAAAIAPMASLINARAKGTPPFSVKNLIAFTQKNEASVQGSENYLSARQKIADVVRRAALDKIIFAPDSHTAVKAFQAFQQLLISEMCEDPFELFAYPEEPIRPQIALERYKEAQYRILALSGWFTSQELQQVRENLRPIGSEPLTYPSAVSVQKNRASHAGSDDLGTSQEVEQSAEQDVEQQQVVQQQQQQQVQQEVASHDEQDLPFEIRKKPALWDPLVDYFESTEWLRSVTIDTPGDRLESHKKTVIYAVSQTHPKLEKDFRHRMWWTNNFLSISTDGAEVGNPIDNQRKPILELLLVQTQRSDGSIVITSGAIDQADASQWRRILEENRRKKSGKNQIKIALYDLQLQTVVDTGWNKLGDQELMQNSDFRLDLIRWKFLAGQPNFSRAIPETHRAAATTQALNWLKGRDFGEMKRLFSDLYTKHGIEPLAGSDMDYLLSERKSLEI